MAADVVAESVPRPIGLISLGAKRAGEPCAGNPHARFDRAGGGNGPSGTAPPPDPPKPRIDDDGPRSGPSLDLLAD